MNMARVPEAECGIVARAPACLTWAGLPMALLLFNLRSAPCHGWLVQPTTRARAPDVRARASWMRSKIRVRLLSLSSKSSYGWLGQLHEQSVPEDREWSRGRYVHGCSYAAGTEVHDWPLGARVSLTRIGATCEDHRPTGLRQGKGGIFRRNVCMQ